MRASFLSLLLVWTSGCAPVDARESATALAHYDRAKAAVLVNLLESGVPRGEAELEDARRLAEGMVALSGRILAADPDAPEFASMEDGVTRTGFANPDNDHLLARIRGDRVYRVRGERGTVADLSIQTFRTFVGSSQGVDEVTLSDVAVAEDGRFEVMVGPGGGSGTWLRSDAQTHWLLIRRTYDDWGARGGDVTIERVEGAGSGSASFSYVERVEQATENLRVTSEFWPGLSRSVLGQLTPNRVMPPTRGRGNLARQWTSMSLFSLSEEEALIVAFSPSTADYQGLQVGSVLFDYFDPYRQVSLSRAQSHQGSDGLLRYVVSARDPGVPNWIDTAGHERGLLLLRWQGLGELDAAGFPMGRVVPFASVLDEFPPDVPHVDAAARRDQLDERRAQLDRRREVSRSPR